MACQQFFYHRIFCMKFQTHKNIRFTINSLHYSFISIVLQNLRKFSFVFLRHTGDFLLTGAHNGNRISLWFQHYIYLVEKNCNYTQNCICIFHCQLSIYSQTLHLFNIVCYLFVSFFLNLLLLNDGSRTC